MNNASVTRVLVVGCGSIGERHARCLISTGSAAVGVCDLDAGMRRRMMERYPLVGAYDTLDEALQYPWDSAVIATPAHTHLKLATRVAEGGVAPLIEKPLAIEESEEIGQLQSALQIHGLSCGVAYVYRAHPAMKVTCPR